MLTIVSSPIRSKAALMEPVAEEALRDAHAKVPRDAFGSACWCRVKMIAFMMHSCPVAQLPSCPTAQLSFQKPSCPAFRCPAGLPSRPAAQQLQVVSCPLQLPRVPAAQPLSYHVENLSEDVRRRSFIGYIRDIADVEDLCMKTNAQGDVQRLQSSC